MPTIQSHELEEDIRTGSYRNVYVLFGPEVYLRRNAVDTLRRSVMPDVVAGFNRSEFSARDNSIDEILSTARTFPFCCSRRLVLVWDLEAADTGFQERLLGYVREPSDKTVLVLVAEDLDRRFNFYKSLRDHAAVVEFQLLKGTRLDQWMEQRIRGQGYKISASSMRKLKDLAGSDLQALNGEIEKLILFAWSDKTISDSAVDEIVAVSRQHKIFELTDAVGKHDRPGALRLLANLVESGESSIGIVVMIARHFRQILIAKEMLDAGRSPQDISAAAQVPPFVLDNLLRQARGFDWNAARETFLRLAEVDRRFRSSSVDQRMILEALICRS